MPQRSHNAAIRAASAAAAIEERGKKAAIRASRRNDRNAAIFKDLHVEMEPLSIGVRAARTSYPLCRIANGDIAAILAARMCKRSDNARM
jgi:hypothetical protein